MTNPATKSASQIPVEACRFAAEFTPAPAANAEPGSPIPFSALARTAQPVPHWYWGSRCLHDFAGMQAAERLPVDWCHDDDEIMGVIDGREITPDGLRVSGKLTPFTPTDRVTEVAFKSAAGVPYQSSIFFDPFQMVVEDVPEGMQTQCNGVTWTGPLVIFRKWTLLGLAVCPYGVDDGTSVTFSKSLSGQTAPITRFTTQGESPVSTATTPETKTEAVTTEAAAAKPAEDKKPVETTAAAPAGTTQLSRAEAFKPFSERFGEHAATLFAKHDTVDAAQIEYSQILRDENKRLREENAKFSKGPQGEKPATFGAAPADKPPTQFANLGDNLSRYAAGLKLVH